MLPAESVADAPQTWTKLAPGSDEELVANFLDDEAERRFRLVCALRDTILSATAQSRDPAVGAVKLDWWRQEIARLTAGEARHPLTTALQESLPAESPFLPWLEELIVCAESLGRRETPESVDGLRLYCFRREGVALTITAAPDGDEAGGQPRRTAARHAGIAWALARTTAALANGRQLFLLPGEMVAAAGLDEIPAGRWSGQPDFWRAIGQLAETGLEELEQARQAIRGACPVTAVVGAVSRTHLIAHRRGAARSVHRSAHPIQLLWHAWRAARRQARSQTQPNQESS